MLQRDSRQESHEQHEDQDTILKELTCNMGERHIDNHLFDKCN